MVRVVATLISVSIALGSPVKARSGRQGKPTSPKGASAPTQASNPDAIHDVISGVFQTRPACESGASPALDISKDLTALSTGRDLDWTGGTLHATIAKYFPDYSTADAKAAYIFHVSHWTVSGGSHFAPSSSNWYVYVLGKRGKLKRSGFRGNGDPLIYGKQKIVIISINAINNAATNFKTTYKTSATQGTAENLQNLGQLIAALAGISQAAFQQFNCNLFIGVGLQQGTDRLPFQINVAASAADAPPAADGKPDSSNPSPGVLTCSGEGNATPCSTTRSFTSLDREWWDVSIGVATPGVRESQYSIVNNALHSSTTLHTDLYGMFDIFPAAFAAPKESAWPHFNVGIPLTSRSFYRPYFGVAESLTGWTHLQKSLNLPVGVNFFAGVTWMKTQVVTGNPTTTDDLTANSKTKRVWKGVFGIEIPIGSIVSKIGKGGGKK